MCYSRRDFITSWWGQNRVLFIDWEIWYVIFSTVAVLFYWLLFCLTMSYCQCPQQQQTAQLTKNNFYPIPLSVKIVNYSQFLCLLTRIFSSDFATKLLYPFPKFSKYATYFSHVFTDYAALFKICSRSSTSGVSFEFPSIFIPGIFQSVGLWWLMVWAGLSRFRRSTFGRSKKFLSVPKFSIPAHSPLLSRSRDRDLKLTILFHPEPSLRMSGAMPPFPIHLHGLQSDNVLFRAFMGAFYSWHPLLVRIIYRAFPSLSARYKTYICISLSI